jgi:hypothetical protein
MPANAGITTEQQQSAQKTQKKRRKNNQSNARSGLHTDLKVRGFIHTLTPVHPKVSSNLGFSISFFSSL